MTRPMWTFYSDDHRLHHPSQEVLDGELVPVFEKPERALWVVERVRERALGPVAAPVSHGLDHALRVHSADYLHYLEHAWSQWSALGRSRDILPYCFPVRGMETKPAHP